MPSIEVIEVEENGISVVEVLIPGPQGPSGSAGIPDDSVDNAKLADMAAYTLKGRNAGTSGDPSDISVPSLTEKTTPHADDLMLLVDSEASNAFKKVKTSNLGAGGGSYTDEQAQDAVGTILADSSRIDLTYNDATPSIAADLIADSVDNTFLANMVAATVKGRATGAGTGDPTDLTAAQLLAIIEATTPLLSEAEAAASYQPLDADLTSWAGVTRASGFDTFASTPSSANLASLVTGETGSGALVFGTSPTLVTPALGTPSALVLTNATGLTSAGVAAAALVTAADTVAGNDNDTTWPTTAALIDYAQPLDADLTAIAALTTNAAGRSLLTLADPGADRIAFWDDSASAYAHLTPGDGVSITGTDLSLDINELTQHASNGGGTSPDWDADKFPFYDSSVGANRQQTLQNLGIREKLPVYPNGDLQPLVRSMFLRTAPIAGTISNATPAVASFSGHDYQAGDPVVFSCPWDMIVTTVTIASPAVFTATAHGYVAGDPVKLFTTGALPTGFSADTTYYVIAAGLTANAFQLSATSGGAAINSSGTQSGEHVVRRATVLPTGVTEGKIYYVIATGLVAGTSFQFSATVGGAAVNTTAAQAGKVWAQTGNDNNDGMTAGRDGAMLTFQNLYQRRICDELDGSNMEIYVHVGGASAVGGTFDADEWQTGMGTEGGDIVIDAADATPVGVRTIYFFGTNDGKRNLRIEDAQHLVYWELHPLSCDLVFQDMYVSCDSHIVDGRNTGYATLTRVDMHRHGANTVPHVQTQGMGARVQIGDSYAVWSGATAHIAPTEQTEIFYWADPHAYVAVNFTEGFLSTKWSSTLEPNGGQIRIHGSDFTFANRITGKRFNIGRGTVVTTMGAVGGLSYLPGDTDGIGKDGAIYDNTIFINGAILSGDVNIGNIDTTLSRSAAGVVAIEGVPIALTGKQSIWIPATAMLARTTNGAASGTAEMSTNKNMVATLDFDSATQEFAQFDIRMPKKWNEETVTFVPVWSHPSTATNFGVVWGLDAVAISDDDTLDVAFGTAQTSSDTGGTTNDLYHGPESSAITIAGTLAAGDYVQFRIHRDVANGSDTMAVDARLHGVLVFYTTDAGNDA